MNDGQSRNAQVRRRLAIIALAVTIVIGLASACAVRWWLEQPTFNDAYVADEILAEVRPRSLAELLDYDDSYVTCNDAEDNDPALSWDGNKLAFASDRDGDWDIFLLTEEKCSKWLYGTPVEDPIDTTVRQLTDDPATDRRPAWSPDGKRIAFDSDRTGVPQVYVMEADGTDVQAVTDGPAAAMAPSWSPDGEMIAYQSGVAGDYDLFVLQSDASGPRRLTDDPASEELPAWSGDGKTIAFVSDRDGNDEIYVIDVASGRETRITEDPGSDTEPAWRGDSVYFSTTRDGYWALYKTHRNGGQRDEYVDSPVRSYTARPRRRKTSSADR